MKPCDSALDILYKDNHIVVFNKKAGLLTQETDKESFCLHALAKEWLKEEKKTEGNVFIHPVHRLDRLASGIVLFAKTSKALSRLNEAFAQRKEVGKKYRAIVEGIPRKEGELSHFLEHGDFRAHVVPESHPWAKSAKLSFSICGYWKGGAIVDITLFSGRYHQIRAQFAHIGHPIVGDRKYGAKTFFEQEAIALHHLYMEISHPVSGQRLEFHSPLPAAFDRFLIGGAV